MKLKFEKSKYPVKKIAFWLLIVFSLFSIFNIFKTYRYNFEVKNLNSTLKPIIMNVEYNKSLKAPLLFCFNDYCAEPDSDLFNNVYSYAFDKQDPEFFNQITKTINLAFLKDDENIVKYIKDITLYIGNDKYYFNNNEIQKFSKKELKIKTQSIDGKEETKVYSAYKIPLQSDNYSGIFNHICVLFLSLFYSSNLFIIPYFWLFFAFCLYYLNKDEFNFKFSFDKKKTYITPGLILILGAILRLDHILYYPLWTDEVYTKVVALENFKTCFQDAGNPPLFFLLEKIATIFSNGDFALRFLPFVFGLGFIYAIYLIFLKLNTKFALFASFLAAVSTINIYHSQEARGYTLSMLLSVLLFYFLNEYLEKKDIKNLIIYSFIAILSINNNYLLSILVFSNFIWAVGYLIIKKSPKVKDFIFANIVSAVTFLPYLYISSKTALSANFNSWIDPIDKSTMIHIMHNYFINGYIFAFLFVIVCMLIVLNFVLKKEYSKFYFNINFALCLTLIIMVLISIFIKPIMHKRVLITLWGVLFLIETSSIYAIYMLKTKNKFRDIIKIFFCVILVFLCFKMNSPVPAREVCRFDDVVHFIQNDKKQYEDYEIHVLLSDNKNYFKQYPSLYNDKNIIWHFIDTNSGKYINSIKKSDYVKDGKKAIIYANAIGIDVEKVLMLNPKARFHKTNSAGNIKVIYE